MMPQEEHEALYYHFRCHSLHNIEERRNMVVTWILRVPIIDEPGTFQWQWADNKLLFRYDPWLFLLHHLFLFLSKQVTYIQRAQISSINISGHYLCFPQ